MLGRRTFADATSSDLQSSGVGAACVSNCFSAGRFDCIRVCVFDSRGAVSFLGARSESGGADHVVVKVTALPAAAPSADLRKEVDAIGEKQIDALHHMFKQVSSSMCASLSVVCSL